MARIDDINIKNTVELIAPNDLKSELSASDPATECVVQSREVVKDILGGDDDRLIVIVGPCSIHNTDLGLEYAAKLKELADKVSERIFVVMRVYFEKPRTTVGWKGLINDPYLNDTFAIGDGLKKARGLLLSIAELGLPTATEMLEPITPQYIADLITMSSIGARTTESPTHRQMASGLSMPVGFKNSTDGNLQIAMDAMQAAKSPHSFLGIDPDGSTCIVNTNGNRWGHLILRGGSNGPNYSAEHLKSATERLQDAKLSPNFVVDCSHANSNKDYRRQSIVWNDVIDQRAAGNDTIIGLMLESNINEGKQALTDPDKLAHGVSITDGCISFEETESLLLEAYEKL